MPEAILRKFKHCNNFTFAVVLLSLAVLSFYFVRNDESYYHKTIAKITAITETKQLDASGEQIIQQQIQAVVMNGPYRGQKIQLQNTTSYSQANDLYFQVSDEVFVKIHTDTDNNVTSADLLDFKRDTYLAYITILFVVLILLIGCFKGLRSLASVVVNLAILAVIIQLFLHGYNILVTAAIASVLFIVISISVVSGANRKTAAAILGTLAGTVLAMLIAVAVIAATHAQGIHYEEMEFLTSPPEPLFMAEILIGTLGAIMDIAISISSSIDEMYQRNPEVDRKTLINSGREIGKDIMGTMANTLVFAYLSGSIPMILLWLRNGNSTFYIVNFNLSLEIIRALTGSIGIVLSIPVTIYCSIILLKHRTGEVLNP